MLVLVCITGGRRKATDRARHTFISQSEPNLTRAVDDAPRHAVTPITRNYIPGIVPIDIDRFERDSEESLRPGSPTNAERILAFLAENDHAAFTPAEVHEETNVTRGSVGVVLSRLEDRGLVRHRGEYWAIAEDEDVGTTLASMATARAATERLGPEDPEEWGPGVGSESGADDSTVEE